MQVTIELPRPLWKLADGERVLECCGDTVGSALEGLLRQHPALSIHLRDDNGLLREAVEVTLDGADSGAKLGLRTPLHDGAVIAILPVIQGGVKADKYPGVAEVLVEERELGHPGGWRQLLDPRV